MKQIGVSTQLFGESLLTEDHLRLIKNAGFQLLEVFAAPGHFEWQDRDYVAYMAKIIRDLDMGVYSLHAPWAPGQDIAAVELSQRQASIGAVLKAVDALTMLGGQVLVLHPGATPSDIVSSAEQLALSRESIAAVAAYCASQDVLVALENPPPYELAGATVEMQALYRHFARNPTLQACFDTGQVKCTYGTGAFVLMNTGTDLVRSSRGLLTTVAWKIGDEVNYALEGSVFIAGAAVQWLRDGLGILSNSAQVGELAASVESSEGVVFVPALVGLGAPRWNPDARGSISGITRGTTAAHLCRATLEGIAFQVRDVVDAMRQDARHAVSLLRVDGGAATNDLLIQFQSDILGVEIHRPQIIETTALGAALLAGLSSGVWKDRGEIQRQWKREKAFHPQMSSEKVAEHLERWEAAVSRI